MTRTILLLAASALALAACDRPGHKWSRHKWGQPVQMTAVSKLDCPEKQGALTRASAAPDGSACAYTADGAEITLKLVSLGGGDAAAAMAPTEAELKQLVPVKAEAAEPDEKADKEVEDKDKSDDVNVNLPGVSIQANDNGAKVNVGPVHIDADDTTDSGKGTVKVNSDHDGKTVSVNANDTGAEVRTQDDRGGIRLTYILTGDQTGPGGYGLVGYEARGPAGGPLVVAVVKAKDQKDRDVFDDMKALVKRNTGG